MLLFIIRCFLSGLFIILGLYGALNTYFKRINPDAIPKHSSLDEETKRKFKAICNMEYRKPIEQEAFLIAKYVEEYTKEHNIDWNTIEN